MNNFSRIIDSPSSRFALRYPRGYAVYVARPTRSILEILLTAFAESGLMRGTLRSPMSFFPPPPSALPSRHMPARRSCGEGGSLVTRLRSRSYGVAKARHFSSLARRLVTPKPSVGGSLGEGGYFLMVTRIRLLKRIAILLMAVAAMVFTEPARAQTTLFWDANGATSGTGGTGNWLTTGVWHSGSSTGTLGDWADGNRAQFSGTAGTVTLNGPVSATGVTLTVSGYTISGANALTLTSTSASSGAQALEATYTGTSTISANIILGAAAGADQRASIGANSTLILSGNISETNAGIILSKSAGGTLTLSGANTYTGGTTVTAGTLLVSNTTGSGTGAGNVTVNGSGTTLGGTGTISSTVTLGNTTPGAILNPGPKGTAGTSASVGTLTTGAVTLTGANTVHIDAFGTATNQWDKLVSTGAISLGTTSTLDVTIASSLTFTPGTTYVLLNGTSLTGTFAGITDGQTVTFNGYDFTADYTATGFDLVAVPEPSTWVGAGLALLAVGFTQRRRFAKRSRVIS